MAVWSVLCDFDGTISTVDVTDTLLEAFGKPVWREFEDEWRAGRIGSRVCMRQQIACLDASREELDDLIDTVAVDENFAAFADAALSRKWNLSIVSDGLDYAILRILRRHGLPGLPVFANHLEQEGPRSWRLEFPYADAACAPASGMCKCALARHARVSGGKVLAIGDGRSDFCVAGVADIVFAKESLIEYCSDRRIKHVPISGFDDALRVISAPSGIESVLSD